MQPQNLPGRKLWALGLRGSQVTSCKPSSVRLAQAPPPLHPPPRPIPIPSPRPRPVLQPRPAHRDLSPFDACAGADPTPGVSFSTPTPSCLPRDPTLNILLSQAASPDVYKQRGHPDSCPPSHLLGGVPGHTSGWARGLVVTPARLRIPGRGLLASFSSGRCVPDTGPALGKLFRECGMAG